jgi:hypothetical protein
MTIDLTGVRRCRLLPSPAGRSRGRAWRVAGPADLDCDAMEEGTEESVAEAAERPIDRKFSFCC